MTRKHDAEAIRQAAKGQWKTILTALGGISAELLDGNHHPCPKCGGEDRFRMIDEAAGALFCNQCFSTKNGDGFAALAWLTDCKFPETLKQIADHLGVKASTSTAKPKKHDPAKDLVFDEWSTQLIQMFLVKKPGITEEALLAAGARIAKYKRSYTVIAIPIIGQELDTEKPVGWVLMNYNGGTLPKWSREGEIIGQVKTKMTFGSQPGLVGTHGIDRWLTAGMAELVWKVEGISDMLALWSAIPEQLRDRHLVLTNANGAQENPRWRASLLASQPANVVHDADNPGEAGAWKRTQAIAAQSSHETRHVQLPYQVVEDHGPDLRDWLLEGHDYDDLLALAELTEPVAPEAQLMPEVPLPGGSVTVTRSAAELGQLLAQQRTHFLRGGAVVGVTIDNDSGQPTLQIVKPTRLASDFESVANLQKLKTDKDGFESLSPAVCSESNARLILDSQAFQGALPKIKVVSSCPVLIEQNGELIEVSGYHEGSGILAGGTAAENVPLDEACKLLRSAIGDYRFASKADLSRALAAMITPALVLGELFKGRPPVDLGEADKSQTGKGYRNKITTAIYRHVPRVVNQRRGIGSLEEAFDKALITGAPFIAIDNVRGKVDSPSIESFLTEDSYSARTPYSPVIEIDPRRIIIMFTSNKADITRDLANRCSCVRILKQDADYRFANYPEGDVLAHIELNQPRYLGAVFAIIRAWHAAGKPKTAETRHDFRAWAQTLDWIVQELLGAAPLMDGHQQTQLRMTNPAMTWLREAALAVVRQKKDSEWLLAVDILEVLDADGTVDIPGAKDRDLGCEQVRKSALQQIGRKLKRCFGDQDSIEIDHLRVSRESYTDISYHVRHRYRVVLSDPADKADAPADSSSEPRSDEIWKGQSIRSIPQEVDPADAPANAPADNPLIKTRDPADPANVSIKRIRKNETNTGNTQYISTMGNVSGISGIGGESTVQSVTQDREELSI